ncbi:MAG: glutathione transferase GstA [Rhizomicrobium sp.]
MKLYFSPGACSLSPHIALLEAGIVAQYEQVDTKTKAMKSGGDFRSISPKGAVPTLELDDGQILTEGPAIVQYIADRRPETKLAPPAGSMARYRLQEWLNYISSEVHKPLSLMFSATATDPSRQTQRDLVAPKFDFLDTALDGKPFLLGEQFTVADGYLFNMLCWTIPTAIDLGRWPAVRDYNGRIASRPAVRAALKAEGLIP